GRGQFKGEGKVNKLSENSMDRYNMMVLRGSTIAATTTTATPEMMKRTSTGGGGRRMKGGEGSSSRMRTTSSSYTRFLRGLLGGLEEVKNEKDDKDKEEEEEEEKIKEDDGDDDEKEDADVASDDDEFLSGGDSKGGEEDRKGKIETGAEGGEVKLTLKAKVVEEGKEEEDKEEEAVVVDKEEGEKVEKEEKYEEEGGDKIEKKKEVTSHAGDDRTSSKDPGGRLKTPSSSSSPEDNIDATKSPDDPKMGSRPPPPPLDDAAGLTVPETPPTINNAVISTPQLPLDLDDPKSLEQSHPPLEDADEKHGATVVAAGDAPGGGATAQDEVGDDEAVRVAVADEKGDDKAVRGDEDGEDSVEGEAEEDDKIVQVKKKESEEDIEVGGLGGGADDDSDDQSPSAGEVKSPPESDVKTNVEAGAGASANSTSSGKGGGGAIATVPLSHDKSASAIVVEEPLVVGELPKPGGNASVKVFTEQFSFDNPDCKDQLVGKMTCQEAQEKSGMSMCNDELYTVDIVAASAAGIDSMNSTLVDSDVNGGILREEEEVGAPKGREADDDDDERRLLEESDDDRVEVKIASPPTDEGDVSLPPSGKLVITKGSRYCPELCDEVPQCKITRDYFKSIESTPPKMDDPEIKGNDDADDEEDIGGDKLNLITDSKVVDGAVELSEVIVGKGDGPAGNATKNTEGNEFPDKNELTTTKVEASSKEGLSQDSALIDLKGGEKVSSEGEEEEGGDVVSTGKVALEPCEADDPDFLYKGKAGDNCEYIAQKPEKCLKLQDGMVVGVSFCPLTCNMKEECKRVRLGAGTAGSGDGDETSGSPVKGDDKVDVKVSETGLNSTSSEIVLNDVSSAKNGKSSGETNDVIGGISSTEPTCVDDPSFLYKDTPGYTCEYIGVNKPEKCGKIHNGQKVGVFKCPVSCQMVAECMEISNVSDNLIMGSGDTPLDKEVSIGGNDGKDKSADTLKAPEKESNGGDVNVISNTTSISLDVEDATTPSHSVACKDDPSFLYKDREGYTCEYIGETKPDKCLKSLNGSEIGVSFCPVSCKMVNKCLESINVSAALNKTNILESPLEEKSNEATAVEEGGEPKNIDAVEPVHGDLNATKMENDTSAKTKSMAFALDSDDSSGGSGGDVKKENEENAETKSMAFALDSDDSSGGSGGDVKKENEENAETKSMAFDLDSDESNVGYGGNVTKKNEEESNPDAASMGNNTTMTVGGTKSMADDLDSDNSIVGLEGNFTKQNEEDSYPDDGKSVGGYGGSPVNNKDDTDEVMTDDKIIKDMDDGGTFESTDGWDSIGSNGLGNSDESELGMEKNPPWADADQLGVFDGAQGGDASTNLFPSGVESGSAGNVPLPNPVPSGLESRSAGNAPLPSNPVNRNEWDIEDDDGFPVGFIVVMFIFLVGVLYRKVKGRDATPTQDIARGGYQPVASRYHTD
ncbi:hypothetical protein ACHAXA_010915, partial [Cyclostephanos tholiformis]